MTNGQPLFEKAPTAWWRVLLLGVAAALVAPVLVGAFLWPVLTGGPDDVPLVVAGPPPAVEQLTAQLEERVPGGFEVEPVADDQVARDAVNERRAYGAVVLSPDGPPEVLVATAASPAVARLLTEAAGGLAPPAATESPSGTAESPSGTAELAPVVEDLAPPPPGDPGGVGIAAGSLPLVLSGLALGALAGLLVTGTLRQLVSVAVGSLLGGPAAVVVLHGWLDALGGDPVVEAAAVSLSLAAVATTIVGFLVALGRVGLALGPLVLVLLGNPLSGAQSAPELLPTGWGALGQVLPPGAIVSLLRSVSGFDGAGSLTPALILVTWLVLGLALVVVGALRQRSRGRVGSTPATAPAPATDVVGATGARSRP